MMSVKLHNIASNGKPVLPELKVISGNENVAATTGNVISSPQSFMSMGHSIITYTRGAVCDDYVDYSLKYDAFYIFLTLFACFAFTLSVLALKNFNVSTYRRRH